MRGLWTPVRLALMRSPKLMELARALNCDRDSALGAAVRWLGFVTEQCCNSACTHLTEADLDAELRRPGLANALQRIGWVYKDKAGIVYVAELGKHSCKKVLTAARVADFRDRQQQDCNENVTPNVTLETLHNRQDKTRQEKNPLSEPYPTTKAEVLGALEQDTTVSMPKERLDRFAQDFLDSVASTGWMDSRGRTIRNWRAFLSKFARNYADNIKPDKKNIRNNNCNSTHVHEY